MASFGYSRLPDHKVRLILALVGYYQHEPKAIYHTITGAYDWPEKVDLDDLIEQATGKIADIKYLERNGLGLGSEMALASLFAARKVVEEMDFNNRNPHAGDPERDMSMSARVAATRIMEI